MMCGYPNKYSILRFFRYPKIIGHMVGCTIGHVAINEVRNSWADTIGVGIDVTYKKKMHKGDVVDTQTRTCKYVLTPSADKTVSFAICRDRVRASAMPRRVDIVLFRYPIILTLRGKRCSWHQIILAPGKVGTGDLHFLPRILRQKDCT